MSDVQISPLAKRLAEENSIDWRKIRGTGPEGRVIERDILTYLARIMSGEADLPAEPDASEPLAPAGLPAAIPGNIPNFAAASAGLAKEGVDLSALIGSPSPASSLGALPPMDFGSLEPAAPVVQPTFEAAPPVFVAPPAAIPETVVAPIQPVVIPEPVVAAPRFEMPTVMDTSNEEPVFELDLDDFTDPEESAPDLVFETPTLMDVPAPVFTEPTFVAPPAPVVPAFTAPEPAFTAPPEPAFTAPPEPAFTAPAEPLWAAPQPAFVVPEPVAAFTPPPMFTEPEAIVVQESTPITMPEPDISFVNEPEPVFAAPPTPVFTPPAPIFTEPAFTNEPEPVFVAPPAPAFIPPEPIFIAPEPVVVTPPEPVFVPEPEPVFVPEPEPVFVPEPEPVFVAPPEPVFVPEPAVVVSPPVVIPEPAPITEPEPVYVPPVVEPAVIAAAVAAPIAVAASSFTPTGSGVVNDFFQLFAARRQFDNKSLEDIRVQLGISLNNREISNELFLARAVGRAIHLLGVEKYTVARLESNGLQPYNITGLQHSFLEAMQGVARATPGEAQGLLVVDASRLGADDLVIPGAHGVLALGRTAIGRGTLTLSGNLPPLQSTEFLNKLAELLENPVGLIV